MEQYFIHSVKPKEWKLCEEAALNKIDIERVPIVLVIWDSGTARVWCPQHRTYEEATGFALSEVQTVAGCHLHGICVEYVMPTEVACLPENERLHFKKPVRLQARWWLYRRDEEHPLILGTEFLELRTRPAPLVAPYPYEPLMKKFLYYNDPLELGEEQHRTYRSVDENQLPDIVAEAVIEALRDDAKKHFGIRPSILSGLKGREKLHAFAERPLDLNSALLRPYFKDFDKDFPVTSTDNFHPFCHRLGIRPPKSLRRLYQQNPFAIIEYRALLELGFRDYNHMRPLLECSRIGNIDFADQASTYWEKGTSCYSFPFLAAEQTQTKNVPMEKPPQPESSDSDGMITQAEIDMLLNGGLAETDRRDYSGWEHLYSFVQFFLSRRGEAWTARYLATLSHDGWERWCDDMCSMMEQYGHKFSDDVKDAFAKYGFTYSVHALMVTEVNCMKYSHHAIRYTKEEHWLECDIGGYAFRLFPDTDVMLEVGQEMDNCIASYMKSALKKKCTLLFVQKDGRTYACIEVQDIRVMQALGPHNHQLEGDVLRAVRTWMRLMVLKNRAGAEFSDAWKEKDVLTATPAGEENFWLYDMRALAKRIPSGAGDGCVIAFLTKFATSIAMDENLRQKYVLADPAREVRDERRELRRVCPILLRVLDAAEAGNGEAMWGMYYLFGEPCGVFTEDATMAEKWKERAREADVQKYPTILRYRRPPKRNVITQEEIDRILAPLVDA